MYWGIGSLSPIFSYATFFWLSLKAPNRMFIWSERLFTARKAKSLQWPIDSVFQFAGKEVHGCFASLVKPPWVSNVSNCKVFFFKERKHSVYKREYMPKRASLPHKALNALTSGKHCQELMYGPMHGLSGVCCWTYEWRPILTFWFSARAYKVLIQIKCLSVGSSFRVHIFFSLRCVLWCGNQLSTLMHCSRGCSEVS